MKKLDSIISKYKQSRFFKMSKIITTSATFALFLSIAFFVYETWDSKNEQKEVIGNLLQIQNSLTTKYLGLFPEYISGINELFEEGLETYTHNSLHKVDTIVIFEDVLYYGIKSRPEGFLKLNELLWHLAHQDCQIFIAYYNPLGKAFPQMIRETLIATPLLPHYERDMQAFFQAMRKIGFERERILATIDNPTQQQRDSISQVLYQEHLESLLHLDIAQQQTWKNDRNNKSLLKLIFDPIKMVDSLKCEEYYNESMLLDPKQKVAGIKQYLKPMPLKADAQEGTAEYAINVLAQQLDSVKQLCIGSKDPMSVTFADYKSMYVALTHTLESFYQSCGSNIHLIPLNDYLTMSCWMISQGGESQAIFAFPSKYATEEIGFYSRDMAIANYIKTMLHGVQVTSLNINQ